MSSVIICSHLPFSITVSDLEPLYYHHMPSFLSSVSIKFFLSSFYAFLLSPGLLLRLFISTVSSRRSVLILICPPLYYHPTYYIYYPSTYSYHATLLYYISTRDRKKWCFHLAFLRGFTFFFVLFLSISLSLSRKTDIPKPDSDSETRNRNN